MIILLWCLNHGNSFPHLVSLQRTEMSICIFTDFKGVLREADCRGREQPERAVATRSWSCSSDYVNVCMTVSDCLSICLSKFSPFPFISQLMVETCKIYKFSRQVLFYMILTYCCMWSLMIDRLEWYSSLVYSDSGKPQRRKKKLLGSTSNV